jgi:hypothetical protein
VIAGPPARPAGRPGCRPAGLPAGLQLAYQSTNVIEIMRSRRRHRIR